MWFRKRDMGYAKVKKIYGHMKVQIQKEKNDEHMKAHVLKKRNSHVLKIKTKDRDHSC